MEPYFLKTANMEVNAIGDVVALAELAQDHVILDQAALIANPPIMVFRSTTMVLTATPV